VASVWRAGSASREGETIGAPGDFHRQSAYANLSAVVSGGGCLPEAARQREAHPGLRAACGLGCREHEALLEEVFEPWWDHRLPQEALMDSCSMSKRRYELSFIAAISRGRVLYRCCAKACEPAEVKLGTGKSTDLEMLLALVGEIADAVKLPDMYFLFNIGDQPFVDKMYWTPVPQFHWVRSHGHWGVPLPNPFQLKAHFQDMLGDGTDISKHHVPWEKKIPKVFWRGSLSAPDYVVARDLGTIPRVRLQNLAKRHPDLFDVAITSVDDELLKRLGKEKLQRLLGDLRQTRHANFARELPKYRYLVNVAAVVSAWRLTELLASGSVLLLQEDSSRELIYEWLTPWEHFVPVSSGLSDLVAKVQWLESHQAEARAIAERGYRHFVARVRRQDTYCYLWQALRAMAAAQEPTRPPKEPDMLRKQGWSEVKPASVAAVAPRHTTLSKLIKAGAGPAHKAQEL